MDRKIAIDLLKKYNKEEFHLRHALTVEGVMKYFARENGEDEEFSPIPFLLYQSSYLLIL